VILPLPEANKNNPGFKTPAIPAKGVTWKN